jgi:hypothetical protein
MDSALHTPRGKFLRVSKKEHDESEDSRWPCKYCAAIDPEKSKSLPTQKRMMHHITISSAESHGQEHDLLKTQDGWYKPDWEVNTSKRKRESLDHGQEKRDRKALLRWGIKYSDDVELAKPIPHPTMPGVTMGGSHDYTIPERFKNVLSYGEPTPLTEIRKRFEGILRFGEPKPLQEIPEEFKDVMSFSKTFDPFDLFID